MRLSLLYLISCLIELLYICYVIVCGFDMIDLTDTDPIDLGFNNIITDSCNYVDPTDLFRERNDSKGLNVIQLNARGILSKQERLKTLLKELRRCCNVHVVLLVETWLTNKNSKRLKIPGYKFIGSHRKNKRGGGVGMLIADQLECRERNDLKLSAPNFETSVVELKTNKDSLFLGSLYRPPNSDASEFLRNYRRFLNKFTPRQQNRMILGMDHNLNLLKHDKHKVTHDFIELNLDLRLLPTITKPTRITRTSATLIDNIIIGPSLHSEYDSDILISDISDHFPCLLNIALPYLFCKQPKRITTRALNALKITEINKKILEIDWITKLENQNVDLQYHSFSQIITEIMDNVSPYHTIKIPYNKEIRDPWLTKGLIQCYKKQKLLYKKSLQIDSTEQEALKYKEYRNKLKEIIRRSKEQYFKDKCLEYKQNTSRLWKMINKILNKTNDKTSVIEYLKVENQDYYDHEIISEEFAKHFANVGRKYAEKIATPKIKIAQYMKNIEQNPHTMFLSPTTYTEIERIIMSLPNKNSSGQDKLTNTLLKQLKESIKYPLEKIFNNSITSGVFPQDMKHADVTPLYKSKEHYLVTNYRPISLLITISKILEKIVYTRTYSFLTTTNQLYQGQYGFRTGHSCQHAVSELIGNIQKNLEQGKISIGVFIDLSKAFDTLDHHILLKKLETYGIRGDVLAWFRSYLADRTIRVKLTNDRGETIHSKCHSLEYGTPQGSCLGPLLFLIFINDLPKIVLNGLSLLFADDTTLLHCHPNINQLKVMIEDDLNRLMDWFMANKLTLNLDKTVCILFDRKQNHEITLNIGGYTLYSSESVKLLGIWIDKYLNWNKHISMLKIKLKQNIHLLTTSRKFLTTQSLKLLYYAHIYSHLTYGLVVWGNMVCPSTINSLQRIMNKCFRIITRKEPTLINYKQEGMLRLQNLIDLENSKLGYQMEHELLPRNIIQLLWTDSKNTSLKKDHRYQTRGKELPNLPTATKSKYSQGFQLACLRTYIKISKEVRHSLSLTSFVRNIKKQMLSN